MLTGFTQYYLKSGVIDIIEFHHYSNKSLNPRLIHDLPQNISKRTSTNPVDNEQYGTTHCAYHF